MIFLRYSTHRDRIRLTWWLNLLSLENHLYFCHTEILNLQTCYSVIIFSKVCRVVLEDRRWCLDSRMKTRKSMHVLMRTKRLTEICYARHHFSQTHFAPSASLNRREDIDSLIGEWRRGPPNWRKLRFWWASSYILYCLRATSSLLLSHPICISRFSKSCRRYLFISSRVEKRSLELEKDVKVLMIKELYCLRATSSLLLSHPNCISRFSKS